MLKVLRELVCDCFDKLDELSSITDIPADDLRSFAFGKSTLQGYDLDQLALHFKLELAPMRSPGLLPFELEESEGIQKDYASDLDAAREILAFSLQVIGWVPGSPAKLPPIQKPRGLTWPIVHLALGIYAKIVKQGRAVIALCELGLVKDASATERCMFEAVLALKYLLVPRVKIREHGAEITHVKIQTGTPNKHGQYPPKTTTKVKKLTTRMRALLYHARDCIRSEEELDDYLSIGRADLVALIGNEKEIRALARRARKAIGPAWTQRQKQTGGYAGVTVKDLAHSYGLLDFYLSIYHRQSKAVHGTDGSDFIDTSDGLRLDLSPSSRNIDSVLFLSSLLIIGAIDTLDGRLGLGFKGDIKRRLREMKKRGSE